MPTAIPHEVLERAPMARVLTCVNCNLRVAHEGIQALAIMQCCGLLAPLCLHCARVLRQGIFDLILQSHVAACKRSIVVAQSLPEPEA